MANFSPVLILAVVVVLYLISSIKILNEYERGVIFRLGKLLPQPKGPGIVLVFNPIDRMVAGQPPDGGARRAAAGHHHARQRVGEGQRRRVLPRDGAEPGDRRGRELPLRDVTARADDAAKRAGAGGARRPALRARAAQSASCSGSSITRPIRGASRSRRSK